MKERELTYEEIKKIISHLSENELILLKEALYEKSLEDEEIEQKNENSKKL